MKTRSDRAQEPEASTSIIGLIGESRRDVGLLAITSADRLHAGRLGFDAGHGGGALPVVANIRNSGNTVTAQAVGNSSVSTIGG